uniref:KIB1-4 beta-propeller domain-containing protein n=1 Tax=Oryza punctata TaxID=4537 RepID=A0A0E0M0T4_ORYPU
MEERRDWSSLPFDVLTVILERLRPAVVEPHRMFGRVTVIGEFYLNGPQLRTSPITNPVINGGLIYLLDEQGRLPVYDPCKHEEGFEIIDKPISFRFGHYDSYYIYMLESDQDELMVILVGQRGTPVHVVKLNENTMEWDKVDSLQGRVLFTGTHASQMKKAELEWM